MATPSCWLLVKVETVCRAPRRLTGDDMAGTGHTGSSRFQLASSGVASAPFELHEVANHSSATGGVRFMGWDCNSGDVSAGVLCRALGRAARAPPSIRRVALYRISVLFARHSGSTPISFACHVEWSRHASANRALTERNQP